MVKYTRRRLGWSRYGRGGQWMSSPMGFSGTQFAPVPYRRKRPPPGAPLRMGRIVRPRMQLKSGRSYTQTKTKRKRRPGNVTKNGDNASLSSNWIKSTSRRRLPYAQYKQLAAPQTISLASTGNFSCTQGRQFVGMVDYLTKGNLVPIKQSLVGTTDKNVRFFMKTGRMKISFKNQSNGNARLTLYDIVPKRTVPNGGLDTPTEAWAKGNLDLTGSGTHYNYIGETPFKSPEFRRYFGVHRVTYVNLEPGMQHEHVMHMVYNKFVDSLAFENENACIPGLTRYCMIVFHGSLGHESLTPATVSTLPVTIDQMVIREWSFSYMETPTATHLRTDGVPTTVVDFDHMGEAGDVDADNIVA